MTNAHSELGEAYGPLREVGLRGKKHLLQVIPVRWESNGEAGDGQTVCVVCGEDTDDGHTADECCKLYHAGHLGADAQVMDYLKEENSRLEQQNKTLQDQLHEALISLGRYRSRYPETEPLADLVDQ